MIDPEDSFGQLDEAATDDQPDSIQSSVKQTEANERRECTYTSSNSVVSSGLRRQNTAPQYVARCRFCRCKFQQPRIAVRHEGRCNVEPVAQCRYCGETHTRADNSDIHIKTCEAYEHAKECLTNKSESDAIDSGEAAETDDSSEDDHFSRRFIDPQPHEFHAYLKWNCEDLDNPLRSYFGLRSLQGEHNFEQHGRLRTTAEIGGSEWTVEFGFKSCGIAPRDAKNFRLDEVREYLVYVYPKGYDSWGAAKSEARAVFRR